MKSIKKYLPVLLAIVLLAGVQVQAQSKKEKEEEIKKLQKMEEIMKMEQMQKQKDLQKALAETKIIEAEELRAIIENQRDVHSEVLKNYRRSLKTVEDENGTTWNFSLPEMRYDTWDLGKPEGLENYFVYRSKESTSLNIHKELEDVTFAAKFKYDVQEGSKSFYFKATGSVADGTILIQLVNPDGKSIQEFEVSPLADVEWSQNFKWTEEEAEKNFGTWTIVVSADNASGSYRVSVRAN